MTNDDYQNKTPNNKRTKPHTEVKNSHGDTPGIVTQNTKKAEGVSIVER